MCIAVSSGRRVRENATLVASGASPSAMLKPDMPVVFDSHALEQRYRLRAVQADTPPMVVSDVPDVRVYMESLGLEFLERPAFDKLPAAVLALLGSHKDHPVLPKAKRELVLSGGQPLDKCRLVYWNDFEPAVFARKRLRAGELLGVVACQVLVHSDIPDDDATVWEVESQPELYTGPALYFCTRAAGNLFRFVRNARLTSRAANVITRQLWIDGRPHMAIEAVERCMCVCVCARLVYARIAALRLERSCC